MGFHFTAKLQDFALLIKTNGDTMQALTAPLRVLLACLFADALVGGNFPGPQYWSSVSKLHLKRSYRRMTCRHGNAFFWFQLKCTPYIMQKRNFRLALSKFKLFSRPLYFSASAANWDTIMTIFPFAVVGSWVLGIWISDQCFTSFCKRRLVLDHEAYQGNHVIGSQIIQQVDS